MVMRNTITKSDGNGYGSMGDRPKKFLLKVGGCDVSFHRNRRNGNYSYYHMGVWDGGSKIGTVDLTTKYRDVKSIVAVATHLATRYQGKGIAHSIYERLVCKHNVTLYSDNQSLGAVKLWRRIAMNKSMRLYFIDNGYE